MKHAECERLADRSHAPPVRALAGLVALALLSAPVAGVTGLVLDELRVDRSVCEFFYMWFWLTVMVVLLASLAAVALWAIVRLGAIAAGYPRSRPG